MFPPPNGIPLELIATKKRTMRSGMMIPLYNEVPTVVAFNETGLSSHSFLRVTQIQMQTHVHLAFK